MAGGTVGGSGSARALKTQETDIISYITTVFESDPLFLFFPLSFSVSS